MRTDPKYWPAESWAGLIETVTVGADCGPGGRDARGRRGDEPSVRAGKRLHGSAPVHLALAHIGDAECLRRRGRAAGGSGELQARLRELDR